MSGLPSAPPAFDASADSRADLGPDVATAVGLFLLEGVFLFVVFAKWFLSGVSFDPAEDPEPDRLGGYLVVTGAVGLFAVLAGVAAGRMRAVVTLWTQVLMAILVVVAVLGGLEYEEREDRRSQPTPAPAWTGPAGCRSGGDSHECASTGG
ncbi:MULTISPECIES: DUF6234 family protein [Streptomyces]|uniref:DUF6234 domain-containing protein n=1 Tax=Streptomyces lasiicapitis TaxID=1923961 RepID=A0ABQ2MSP5_9ACTN|nr:MULTISPECIES: DUF6234 family protein [Streptomyces]QIB47068.1 hypothetical protein G3H79_32280 [Streptomyces aureoverticillatus]GGO58076.1 hypothetical protein GCM10012286_76400 [Streptomyces lasiicapitis]